MNGFGVLIITRSICTPPPSALPCGPVLPTIAFTCSGDTTFAKFKNKTIFAPFPETINHICLRQPFQFCDVKLI